jgi:hypothetical protein
MMMINKEKKKMEKDREREINTGGRRKEGRKKRMKEGRKEGKKEGRKEEWICNW